MLSKYVEKFFKINEHRGNIYKKSTLITNTSINNINLLSQLKQIKELIVKQN